MKYQNFKDLFKHSDFLHKRTHPSNSLIFCQNDPATHVFVVESGQVVLERTTLNGKNVITSTANPGSSFAEAALFASHYHCTARTTCESEITHFPKQFVMEILRSNSGQALAYIHFLSTQVMDLRTRLEIYNTPSAEERVLQFLQVYADSQSSEYRYEGTLKNLSMSLGLTHETLYRTLSKLEKNGSIRRSKGCIQLLNAQPL